MAPSCFYFLAIRPGMLNALSHGCPQNSPNKAELLKLGNVLVSNLTKEYLIGGHPGCTVTWGTGTWPWLPEGQVESSPEGESSTKEVVGVRAMD